MRITLLGALILVPSVAAAERSFQAVVPEGAAPMYGFVAEARPESRGSNLVFARQVLPPASSAAVAQSRVIYLNHNGVTLRPGNNDSSAQTSSIVTAQTAIPAWSTSAQEWTDTVTCFRGLWSRFDVQVVDTDPGNVPHMEAVFGGTPGDVGLPSNVGGVSPFTTDCSVIESSIVFTFVDAIPNITARQACEIMAQEVAHSYGLDHELLAADPMTYLTYSGNRAFQDSAVSCGEFSPRDCGINGSVCSANQNSVAMLGARVGFGDPTPPVLTFASPADGATVPLGFDVRASGTDNIAVTSATLYIDGVGAVTQATAGPYTFATPMTLAPGPHTIKVEITDGKNVQSQTRTITVVADASGGAGGDAATGGDNPNDVTGGCAAGGNGASLLFGLGVVLALSFARRS